MAPTSWRKYHPCTLLAVCIILDVPAALSAVPSSQNVRDQCPCAQSSHRRESSATSNSKRRRSTRRYPATVAFQHGFGSSSRYTQPLRSKHYGMRHSNTALCNDANDDSTEAQPGSFLSTRRANVSFKSKRDARNGNARSPANLSPVDRLLLALTSDRTSLLLGSLGILLLLSTRALSFPDDPLYEASRSRIDLLGVCAAGSVLLNGLTKLDVESAQAERVALEGVSNAGAVAWNGEAARDGTMKTDAEGTFKATVEWALCSFLKCSPARTAVLLTTQAKDNPPRWRPLATAGILPLDPQLRTGIPEAQTTPILDRMLRGEAGKAKGGTVGGTTAAGAPQRRGPPEAYLPTLQALPGKVEFTYLPANAQEALLLPVPGSDGEGGGGQYAVVLGGDTAKSFAPRDIAWCKEIASWIGDLV